MPRVDAPFHDVVIERLRKPGSLTSADAHKLAALATSLASTIDVVAVDAYSALDGVINGDGEQALACLRGVLTSVLLARDALFSFSPSLGAFGPATAVATEMIDNRSGAGALKAPYHAILRKRHKESAAMAAIKKRNGKKDDDDDDEDTTSKPAGNKRGNRGGKRGKRGVGAAAAVSTAPASSSLSPAPPSRSPPPQQRGSAVERGRPNDQRGGRSPAPR
jgi:hypothetical protein